MAGDSPQVLTVLTKIMSNEFGRVGDAFNVLKIKGKCDFKTSLLVAQLALKNRPVKTATQRIIVFIASPISNEVEELVQVAKKLKKMQVNVDVVNFGETSSNTSKLDRFIETVNNNGNSHLITVPPGTMLHLADIVMESPICMSGFGAIGGAGSGGGHAPASTISNQFEDDIQRAIQLSMMDAGGGAAPSAAAADSMGNEDDDDDLRQAMLLSIQLANADAGAAAFQTPVAAPPSAAAAAPSGDDSMGADDDDEDIRLALLMSMQQDQAPPAEKKEEDGQGGGEGGGMDS